MNYELSCDCGEVVSIEASTREEAITKAKQIMNEDAVKEHMETKHPGQPMITASQAHAMIEQNLRQI